ncbi:MAG: CRTAC1 family protein [Alphaproteobacteria bacterium]|nr:CRTAC1 family protein [Alphaproteobacteria bacterium]
MAKAREIFVPYKLVISLLAATAVCGEVAAQSPAPPRYANDSTTSGIAHSYIGGWEFFVGGGVATFDCDADGRPDLYFAGGENRGKLYRNTTRTGGRLTFALEADSRAALTAVTGAYPLDIDGDGHLDLALLRLGENVLFRGLGDCRFERANETWGFEGGQAWSTAFTARWDQNRDWPTIVIGNYVDRDKPGSPWGTCHDNLLFRPAEDDGFSPPLPLRPSHCALSALFTDWNRSGIQDLRLSNDKQYDRDGEEQLWRVPADGQPTPYGAGDGWRHLTIWGMGIASHDVTGDGYPEYVLTSMGDNKLRVLAAGPGQPTYMDAAYKRGMTAHRPYAGGDLRPSTAWHAEFKDVNNDTFMDLFIAKGNVEAMKEAAIRDPNNILIGDSDGRFIDGGEAAGIVTYASARGASLADFNLDGLPDLVVVNRKAGVEVWRNVGRGSVDKPAPMGNWLQLKLRQDGGNRNAVGAWIEVRIGSRTLLKEVTVGGGHASGHAGWIHFGVGAAERAEVRVQWPGGAWSDWIELATNQFAHIVRDAAQADIWQPRE